MMSLTDVFGWSVGFRLVIDVSRARDHERRSVDFRFVSDVYLPNHVLKMLRGYTEDNIEIVLYTPYLCICVSRARDHGRRSVDFRLVSDVSLVNH